MFACECAVMWQTTNFRQSRYAQIIQILDILQRFRLYLALLSLRMCINCCLSAFCENFRINDEFNNNIEQTDRASAVLAQNVWPEPGRGRHCTISSHLVWSQCKIWLLCVTPRGVCRSSKHFKTFGALGSRSFGWGTPDPLETRLQICHRAKFGRTRSNWRGVGRVSKTGPSCDWRRGWSLETRPLHMVACRIWSL